MKRLYGIIVSILLFVPFLMGSTTYAAEDNEPANNVCNVKSADYHAAWIDSVLFDVLEEDFIAPAMEHFALLLADRAITAYENGDTKASDVIFYIGPLLKLMNRQYEFPLSFENTIRQQTYSWFETYTAGTGKFFRRFLIPNPGAQEEPNDIRTWLHWCDSNKLDMANQHDRQIVEFILKTVSTDKQLQDAYYNLLYWTRLIAEPEKVLYKGGEKIFSNDGRILSPKWFDLFSNPFSTRTFNPRTESTFVLFSEYMPPYRLLANLAPMRGNMISDTDINALASALCDSSAQTYDALKALHTAGIREETIHRLTKTLISYAERSGALLLSLGNILKKYSHSAEAKTSLMAVFLAHGKGRPIDESNSNDIQQCSCSTFIQSNHQLRTLMERAEFDKLYRVSSITLLLYGDIKMGSMFGEAITTVDSNGCIRLKHIPIPPR